MKTSFITSGPDHKVPGSNTDSGGIQLMTV